MSLFIITTQQINGNLIDFNEKDAYHLFQVLRKRSGDTINCLDEQQTRYQCVIKEISQNKATAQIISTKENSYSQQIPITLIFPLLKGKKTEWILQKGTEIGATRFIPYLFKRTVVRPEKEKKLDRFKKIIHEACKQSEQGIPPEITPIMEFKELEQLISSNSNQQLRIMCWVEQKKRSIKELFQQNKHPQQIIIAIGPEGGITEQEVNNFKNIGFQSASLGRSILRSETACLAALAMTQYEYSLD